MSSPTDVSDEPVTAMDVVLTASRALVGVVARSLAPALEELTLPQFRVLVILSNSPRPVRIGAVADQLGVHPSTFSRTADRLSAADWIRRVDNPDSRRETLIELTPRGRRLVSQVTRRRRDDVAKILRGASPRDVQLIVHGMQAFARLAGEPPTDLSQLGM